MLKISALGDKRVFVPKKPKTDKKTGEVTERASKLGRVRMAVFSPDGSRMVGILVRRPDVVGMVKREDAFVAWDSFEVRGKDVMVTRPEDGMGADAIKRLGVDWDACIMWQGMDAKTESGKELGYVSDAAYDEKTGRVATFYVGDGGMSRALVGSLEVPASMVRGYRSGWMVLSDEAAGLIPDGGFAATAGEGFARAKQAGAEAAGKAGEAAGKAVDKGSFALGKALGKAKRAIEEATADDEKGEDAKPPIPQAPPLPADAVRVEKPAPGLGDGASPVAPAQPKTYRPTNAKPSAAPAPKKPAPKKATGDQAAKAVGKQLGRMGKMFGSFSEEFKKASK